MESAPRRAHALVAADSAIDDLSGLKGADAEMDRVRRGHEQEPGKVGNRLWVRCQVDAWELTERVDLARERHTTSIRRVEKRLDPEAVASEEETALPPVEDGHRE